MGTCFPGEEKPNQKPCGHLDGDEVSRQDAKEELAVGKDRKEGILLGFSSASLLVFPLRLGALARDPPREEGASRMERS
jgi:hypothetical protein